ncbi:MAG: hypothetical protein KBC30_09915 [Planctomycetes bacterium]|nr:hypothetical protein [Planctomycetota bacterium]HNZ65837.1 hypothetical protein [Planctomycetota bacterium]HON45043.1 hypothetical protein [Planctomycetota bacterium]HPY75857.1 hypothetical protein [Planctomycetota bacterium]HQB01438.1 hypothetical protein [Planctomycetota bacterium]
MDKPLNICVICSGNISRSPFGEYVLRKELKNKHNVYSAGTLGIFGRTAYEPCIIIGKEYGLDLTPHRSQGLTPIFAEKTDFFLVMTHQHSKELQRNYGISKEKILLLSDFLENDDTIHLGILGDTKRGEDIPDPMGQKIEVVRPVLEVVRTTCLLFVKWLETHGKEQSRDK